MEEGNRLEVLRLLRAARGGELAARQDSQAAQRPYAVRQDKERKLEW